MTREDLKQDLLQRAAALGQGALLPTEKSELNAIAGQLESLNPTPAPLASENRALLLGDWQLIYASNGTVVTRKLPGGLTIQAIWQILSASAGNDISVTNGMKLEFPLLGTVQLQAQGRWRSQDEAQTATVTFDDFSLQGTNLMQQAGWQLPALTIPVLDWMRREAIWQTSYLDAELRIGRGATGNLFVFTR